MTTTSREYAEALFELAVQGDLIRETTDGVVTVEEHLFQRLPQGKIVVKIANRALRGQESENIHSSVLSVGGQPRRAVPITVP